VTEPTRLGRITMGQTISCPEGGTEIPLTEAISSQLSEEIRREYECKAQAKERELAKEREALAVRQKQLEESRKAVDETVSKRLAEERVRVEAEAKKKASESVALAVADLQNQVAEKEKALGVAQKNELEIRKKQRELEAEKKNLELEVERRLDAERKKVQEDAVKAVQEEHRLKDLEKDKRLADVQAQLAEAQRRAEQGSQQTQGETLELDLEQQLKAVFPHDSIEPVPKGKRGADVIQRVCDHAGRPCGAIVWEAKRTKGWSAGWVEKLKDDKREAKAELAVLLTAAMPKDVETFGQHEGVWVTNQACAMSLGLALRESLIRVTAARTASVGKQSKLEMLYDYLSGSEFKHRVEAIVEAFVAMKAQLDTEKSAMNKAWAAREKQIERVMTNTTGMYGDLEGIIGAALPTIPHLEMKAITGPHGEA